MEPYKATECKVAVLIASGPSVTQDQLDNVREWQKDGGGIVMTVNRSFEAAPWADYLFTIDGRFLRAWEDKIREFKGTVLTHKLASYYPDFIKVVPATCSGNSGSAGIEVLSRDFKCKKIILVGCDAKWSDKGKKHHHEDYPDTGDRKTTLNNCSNIHEFKGCFEKAIKRSKDVEIINCSPDSALRFLPNMPIKEALYG